MSDCLVSPMIQASMSASPQSLAVVIPYRQILSHRIESLTESHQSRWEVVFAKFMCRLSEYRSPSLPSLRVITRNLGNMHRSRARTTSSTLVKSQPFPQMGSLQCTNVHPCLGVTF